MVPNSGSELPFSLLPVSDGELAEHIAKALRNELGGTRRATKTVMGWTEVSDHTARSWLQGRSSPSGRHLVALAAHSELVLQLLLELAGHRELTLHLRLGLVEKGLEDALAQVRALRRASGTNEFAPD